MRIYAIRDVKDNSFNPALSLAGTDASASRAFGQAINNPQSGNLYSYPADYELYYLGDFDPELGKISLDGLIGVPIFVVRGDALQESKSE